MGIQDWDQNFAWSEVTRKTFLEYNQFPFWNPFKCGGSSHFGSPEIAVISIKTLLVLAAGTIVGTKISLIFYSMLGFVGFYLLARRYRLSIFASYFSSIIFSFSGITASYLSTGMVVFANMAHSPFVLYFFEKADESKKNILLSAVFLATSYYFEYHIPLLLIIYIAIYSLFTSIVKKNLKSVINFLILFFAFVVIAAPKLILSLRVYESSQILRIPQSGYKLSDIPYFLLSRSQSITTDLTKKEYRHNIDEMSLYVGFFPIVIFLIFFINNKYQIKKAAPIILTMLTIFWIMLGVKVTPSLYEQVKSLPIMESFRVSQRFRFDFIIPFSLICGLGLDNLLKKIGSKKGKALLVAILLIYVYLDLFTFSNKNFLSHSLIIKDITFTNKSSDFRQKTSIKDEVIIDVSENYLVNNFKNTSIFIPWSYEYVSVNNMVGTIDCSDVVTQNSNVLSVTDQSYKGEWYSVNSTKKVILKEWSPNEITLDIQNIEGLEDILVINQNYYPGWYVSVNDSSFKEAKNYNGLVATNINKSTTQVKFKFLPFKYTSNILLKKINFEHTR